MTRTPGLLIPIVLLCLTSCNPLTMPMPAHLDEKSQASIDESWEKALKPVDRLDHQVMLDTLVGTNAYQLGVDKLYFRSEKRFAGGLVVMEVRYDRATPAEDEFDVRIEMGQGVVVRRERYSRDEVEKTYGDLSYKPPQLAPGQVETPQQAEVRARVEARWARIQECFPKAKEDEKK